MLKLYSRGCEYVIRTLAQISESDSVNGFSLGLICKKARTPQWFTRKVFQSLVRNGLLEAKRGPGGGYRFKVHPSQVSVLRIIEAVDGEDTFSQCVLGRSKCMERSHCSFHPIWQELKGPLMVQLRRNTVAQLMRK